MADLSEYNREELMALVICLAEGRELKEVESYIVPNKKALSIDNFHYMLCNMSHAPGDDSCHYYAEQNDDKYCWTLETHKRWHAKYDSVFGDTTPSDANMILNAFGQLLFPYVNEDNYPIFIALIRAKFDLD